MAVLASLLAAALAGLSAGELEHAETGDHAVVETGRGPAAPAHGVRIRRVILRVEGLPWEEVRQALAPRLVGVEILRFEDAGFTQEDDGELLAYVEIVVSGEDAGPVDLTIVLSDRRGYLRHATEESGRSARSIAVMVANTLVAIEQEQLEPDQQDQEIPRPPPRSSGRTTSAPDEPEPPPFELGLGGALHPTFGLAPAGVRGFAALAGELRVSMQQRRGARVELGLRVGGRSHEGYRLWRERVHLAAGFGWQRERFGVATVIGPTIEPWRVRHDGAVVKAEPLGSAKASPLFGMLVAVTPALRFDVASRVAMGLGLRTELAVAVLRSGAAGRVLGPTVLFGVGGLELTTALELTVWIGSRPES